MGDIEYLYSFGRRRHIRRPGGQTSRSGWSAEAYCGDWFETEDRAADTLRWWDNEKAEDRMARKKAEPICKRCERALFKARTAAQKVIR